MSSKLLSFAALVALCLAQSDECTTESCTATSNWPGWSGIKYAFVFGDSYSTTGFDINGTQPTDDNPLGNPTYWGWTASNGPNWVDFLTVEYNASILLTYNIAYGGATVDSDLVEPYEDTVISMKDQVEQEFLPRYGDMPSDAPWSSDDTLFAFFIGLNDVGDTYYEGVDAYTTINSEIFDVYSTVVDEVYNVGGRNFLFLNVPPVDQSPLTAAYGETVQEQEAADITAFNDLLVDMAEQLKSNYSDTNVFTFDTRSLFLEVLADPSTFEQTSIYQNTTDYCVAYENGTAEEDTYDASCYIPVNEYFWLNSLHPTYPLHEALAQQISITLEAGPNIC